MTKESEKRCKKLKIGGFTLILVLWGFVLFPWPQVEAARPLTADDVGTVERGAFELEMGYDLARDEDHTQNQSLGMSLKHGLIQRFDLCIALPYQIKPDEEFGDAEVGIKYLLLRETGNLPALCLTFGCELGSPECALAGVASKEIGYLALHINLGYMASGFTGEDGMTVYAGAIEYALSKSFTLAAELAGEADAHENVSEALVGGNYRIFEQVVLDFAVGKGVDGATAKEGKATLGLTYGF